MKKDAKEQLKSKGAEELRVLIKTAREKLEQMKFDLESGKSAIVKDIRRTKKEIARMLTLINQKKDNN